MNQPQMIDVVGKQVSPMDSRDMFKLCYYQAKHFSDDPNTRNGALIINKKGLIIGTGSNRMPCNSLITPENLQSPRKYDLIEHAERDAVYAAARWTSDMLDGCTMFCPFACCADCARAIGLSGIKSLVIHTQCMERLPERWQGPVAMGHDILGRMGVGIIRWSGVVGDCENLFDGTIWKP